MSRVHKLRETEYKNHKLNHKIKELCRLSYDSGVPRCFDWRSSINNTNYDTPIKRQGDCGSCYSVALLSATESRIRIKSNNRE